MVTETKITTSVNWPAIASFMTPAEFDAALAAAKPRSTIVYASVDTRYTAARARLDLPDLDRTMKAAWLLGCPADGFFDARPQYSEGGLGVGTLTQRRHDGKTDYRITKK